ncbi:MAG: hypothetical protein NC203_09700 [Firmicutes bacterium]|nr:hypothetical protein [[Eubacterium] siraeum]MCM1488629.1 hypothetical protein [Bacillota bacterium]
MKIYTNTNHRVVALYNPPKNTEGIKEIEVPDDSIFASFSDTKKLCYHYDTTHDITTYYPAMDLDTIAVLERKQAEIDSLNEAVNTLILESLMGEE